MAAGDATVSRALSPRELEILVAAAGGLTQKVIAAQMGCSVQTVKNHLYSVYTKLEVTTLVGALNAMGWVHVSGDQVVLDQVDRRLGLLRREVAELADTLERLSERRRVA
jgi:DNA-binding CsgD family transcriptional regulator